MKKRLPICLAFAAVLAAGLFLLWYGRPQSLAGMIPTPLGPVTSWEIQLNDEKTGQSRTFPLDLEQSDQVLETFTGQTLRRRYSDLDGVADSYQSSMGQWARIYLTDDADPSTRCELMLMGDYLVINQIGADKAGTYTLSGGQEFQEKLIQLLLEFGLCAQS